MLVDVSFMDCNSKTYHDLFSLFELLNFDECQTPQVLSQSKTPVMSRIAKRLKAFTKSKLLSGVETPNIGCTSLKLNFLSPKHPSTLNPRTQDTLLPRHSQRLKRLFLMAHHRTRCFKTHKRPCRSHTAYESAL